MLRRLWLMLVLVLPVACIAPSPAAPESPPTVEPTNVRDDAIVGDLVVFAAASLTEAFREVAADFQRVHPDSRVVLNFGGSSQLRVQLENGARADVFASADQVQMDAARRAAAVVSEDTTFVRNRLMVIAPRDNPANVSSLADLARPNLKLIGAQPNVPIGVYTDILLQAASTQPAYGADFSARVTRNMVSREDTVRQVVAKIQLGEGDAAVVYTTDVTPQIASQFVRIPVPDDLVVIASYPIAVTHGRNPAGGEAFVRYVLSEPARTVLARWGFLLPTEGDTSE